MIYGYEEPAPDISLTMPAPQAPEKENGTGQEVQILAPSSLPERIQRVGPRCGAHSIWIPWDEAGGSVKRVSLIPIFKMDRRAGGLWR
jgi:hypothetical protein